MPTGQKGNTANKKKDPSPLNSDRARADALVAQRCAFVGGAARSGTTYVQLLLYATGLFASAQESHLFGGFLGRMDEAWRRFEDTGGVHRRVGLPAIMPQSDFDGILRTAAIRVLKIIGQNKPEAPWILEKTPDNVGRWPLIIRLLPKARFIIVTRDPRAVVASTKAAREWAREWAHRDVARITENWMKSVRAGFELEAAHPHVARVSYERLLADAPNVLIELMATFDIELSMESARRIAASVSLEALREGRFAAPWPLADEPENFYRRGDNIAWLTELSIADIALIEDIAAEEMRILGYTSEAVLKRRNSVGYRFVSCLPAPYVVSMRLENPTWTRAFAMSDADVNPRCGPGRTGHFAGEDQVPRIASSIQRNTRLSEMVD